MITRDQPERRGENRENYFIEQQNRELTEFLRENYQMSTRLTEELDQTEYGLREDFYAIDRRAAFNQLRLLRIFQKNAITDFHLNGSTGYG